jgi:hypothetical protein
LNEVIAAFVQDKTTIERGLFDEELVPEELTQVRMRNPTIPGPLFRELAGRGLRSMSGHHFR